MKMVNLYSLKWRTVLFTLFCLFLLKPALPQRISELPPATSMVMGDLMPIVHNGVTKKLAYTGLINSLHKFSDSLFVNYRCNPIKGESQWYFTGDTIFIDTCYVASTSGSSEIPITISSTNYTSSSGSEAIAFIDLSTRNDTLFLGSATTRLNDMIYVARTDLFANSVVIIGSPGIYYRSAGFTNFWLSKTMSGAILQSDGTAWYIIGIFFDKYETPTKEVFRDSTAFTNNVEFLSSIHAINLDSARTAYQLYYNSSTGEFSYDSIPFVLHSIDTVIVIDSVFVKDTVLIDSPDLFTRDPFISTDSTAKGSASRQIAGETLVFGDLCYMKSDGKMWMADADSVIYLPGLFMLVDKEGAAANDTAVFLTDGYVRCNARWSWATKGAVLYASGTAGGVTDSAPSGANDGVQTVGIVQTADIIRFRPDLLVIELN